MNAALLSNLDLLVKETPEAELPTLLGELAKRVLARKPSTQSLELRDTNDRTIAKLIPSDVPRGGFSCSKEEFIARALKRIDNPPERYLTVDEFFARLEQMAIEQESDRSKNASHLSST